MIERIDDMPPGTIGLRAVGSLDAADFSEGIAAPLREVADGGEELRLILEIPAADFARVDPFALASAARAGIDRDLRHAASWKRTAVVSDAAWVRQGVAMAGGLLPGQVAVFAEGRIDAAKEWVVG